PLEEDRLATLEPAWSIPSSDLPVPKNNWASALAFTYSPSPEDSLLAQIGDMAMFMDWFCKRQGITKLKPQDLEGPVFELVKVTIQSDFFFNKDLEYLRYGSKGNRSALSISKMKAAYYPDVGLEKMVPDQMWIEEECKYDIAAMYGISHWWFQGQRFYIDRHTSKKIAHRIADLNEHMIAERDFKYLCPSDFEDLQRVEDFQLGIESYQTQLNLTKPRWDATGFKYKHDYTVIDSPRVVTFRDKYGVQLIMQFNEIHTFSDCTLHQIDEALDYRVKEFKKRLETKRIFRNLESFDGGRTFVADAQYMVRDVSNDEINVSMLDIDDNKAPCSDGLFCYHLNNGVPKC
nr:hypothetical protein [Tanacetum cinerariifolium]